ncbi:hypothetical protein ACTA71_008052 [Dictyostelium dimigraforme]
MEIWKCFALQLYITLNSIIHLLVFAISLSEVRKNLELFSQCPTYPVSQCLAGFPMSLTCKSVCLSQCLAGLSVSRQSRCLAIFSVSCHFLSVLPFSQCLAIFSVSYHSQCLTNILVLVSVSYHSQCLTTLSVLQVSVLPVSQSLSVSQPLTTLSVSSQSHSPSYLTSLSVSRQPPGPSVSPFVSASPSRSCITSNCNSIIVVYQTILYYWVPMKTILDQYYFTTKKIEQRK